MIKLMEAKNTVIKNRTNGKNLHKREEKGNI